MAAKDVVPAGQVLLLRPKHVAPKYLQDVIGAVANAMFRMDPRWQGTCSNDCGRISRFVKTASPADHIQSGRR